MKLNPKENKTETSEQFQQNSEFTIDPDSVDIILDFLRNKLYSNKPLAVIREISCNGMDGHVAAGTPDKPIEIHIPTIKEPYFSVKDFGPGLSPEEIDKTYTKFGKSTKRETNDQVGALGLGCKAPHAYTDSFTVESTKNGATNIFACYLKGAKAYADLINSTPTPDQPTGTKVTVPIEPAHIGHFTVLSQNFYQTFEPKPKFNIDLKLSDKYEWKNELYFEKDNLSWSIYPNFSKVIVVMGNVPYELSNNSINKLPSPNIYIDKSSYYNSYNCYGMIIRAPIGSVDFTISREAMEYTPRTIEFLKQANITIRQTVAQQMQEKLAKAKDFYEAHQIKDTINKYNPRYMEQKDFTWRDKIMQDYLLNTSMFIEPERYKCQIRRLYKYETPSAIHIVVNTTEKKLLFVDTDKKALWTKKVSYYLNKHPEYEYAVEVKFPDQDTKDKFFKKYNLDLFDWVKTSELEKPPKSETVSKPVYKTKKHSLQIFTFDKENTNNIRRSNYWTSVEDPSKLDTTQKVYVILDSFFYLFTENNSTSKNNPLILRRLISRNNHIDIPDTIYGIKKKTAKDYTNKKDWILLSDFIEQETKKALDSPELIEQIITNQLWDNQNVQARKVLDLVRDKTLEPTTQISQRLQILLKRLNKQNPKNINRQIESRVTNYPEKNKEIADELNLYPNVENILKNLYGEKNFEFLAMLLSKWSSTVYGYNYKSANPELFAYMINLIDKDKYGKKNTEL